jgi:hypothetical protein
MFVGRTLTRATAIGSMAMGDEYPNISQARQSKGMGERFDATLLTD